MNGPSPVREILVPTDFSENAAIALPTALEWAEREGATVHLLHVLEAAPILGEFGTAGAAIPHILQDREAAARRQLAELRRSIPLPGDRVRLSIAHGLPSQEIVDYAAAQHVDMIVMATHGHTGLRHLFLGSCAERVVRQAPCPVLTIGAQAALAVRAERQEQA